MRGGGGLILSTNVGWNSFRLNIPGASSKRHGTAERASGEGRVIDTHRERKPSKYADSVFTAKYGAHAGADTRPNDRPSERASERAGRQAGRQADLQAARSNIPAA